jgi:hypothetical protein
MKKSLVVKADRTMEKVKALTRHIRNVEDNCLFLGEKLIRDGEIELGHHLIANGFIHDASKFFGIEWDYLSVIPKKEEETKLKLKLAVQQHNSTNKHHPEAWDGIENMPSVYIAEMVCDWKARSEEFGTSLREWIDNEATKRYGFTKDSALNKEITKYVDLLCGTPFSSVVA